MSIAYVVFLFFIVLFLRKQKWGSVGLVGRIIVGRRQQLSATARSSGLDTGSIRVSKFPGRFILSERSIKPVWAEEMEKIIIADIERCMIDVRPKSKVV